MRKHMINEDLRRVLLILSVLLGVPNFTYADAGVPMIFLTLPGMLIALTPIIAIESYIFSKQLSLPYGRAVKACSVGNLISTIIGLPITWIGLVLVQLVTGGGSSYGLGTPLKKFLAVTWQAPWLIPYEPQLHWMIPAATLTLLIPFFFTSWFIEYQASKRILKEVAITSVNRATRNANLLSYSLLAIVVLGFFVVAKL